jgi:hypothetical protein
MLLIKKRKRKEKWKLGKVPLIEYCTLDSTLIQIQVFGNFFGLIAHKFVMYYCSNAPCGHSNLMV